MKATKWIWIWIVTTMVSIVVIMSINYVVDPLWFFGHNNSFSNIRIAFNERQQKTNYLYNTKEQYNTLLLGSSRTTYLAPEYFRKLKVFNYAANNMRPDEYLGYLDNYTEITGHAPETVILGLDFWGSSSTGKNEHKAPKYYLTQRKNWHYLISSLASIDAIKYSLKNIKYELTGPPLNDAYYTQELTKLEHGQTAQFREQRIRTQIKHYTDKAYGNYQWDTSYASTLQRLKSSYPNTEFIVFTTPIRDTLYYPLVRNHLEADYGNWLMCLVKTFRTLHHFMEPDKYANTDIFYYDTQHFKPELAKLYAPILEDRIDWQYHIDHTKLTEENLNNYKLIASELLMIYHENFQVPKPITTDIE